jgi:hypothetical protein
LLAALFAFAGLLSFLTRSSRRSRILFGITTVVALLATYLWVVGGGIGGLPVPQGVPSTRSVELPGSCTRQTAARLVEEFFAKWNDRDVAGVARIFSPSVSFHDNVAGHSALLSGQDELRLYLTGRFELDDRFSNVIADIPENPSPTAANPTVSFMRSVGTATYRGNAKLVCVDDLLSDVVMSAE